MIEGNDCFTVNIQEQEVISVQLRTNQTATTSVFNICGLEFKRVGCTSYNFSMFRWSNLLLNYSNKMKIFVNYAQE